MRSTTRTRSLKLTRQRRPRVMSKVRLEAQREALLKRINRLHPKIRTHRGYRSARALLTSRYRKAIGLAARLGILQAADFMIGILEQMPQV